MVSPCIDCITFSDSVMAEQPQLFRLICEQIYVVHHALLNEKDEQAQSEGHNICCLVIANWRAQSQSTDS